MNSTVGWHRLVAGIAVMALSTVPVAAAAAGSSQHGVRRHLRRIEDKVAHFEADGTTPGHPGVERKPRQRWPRNVTRVTYLATTRDKTGRWFGEGRLHSHRRVVVVELRGHFAVETTGPSSNIERGTVELAEATISHGRITDFALSDKNRFTLPNGTVVYRRS
jgi:hypothetical protein